MRYRYPSWGAIALVVVIVLVAAVGITAAFIAVPPAVNRAMNPPTATVIPTPTPGPCSLSEYGMPGNLTANGSITIKLGNADVTLICENSSANIQTLTLPVGGCWLDQAANKAILEGQVRQIDGEPYKCIDGNLIALNPAAPQTIPTATPKVGCMVNDKTVPDGGYFTESDGLLYQCVGGQKQLQVQTMPTVVQPTVAQPTATAAPIPFAFCALPSPDGKGNTGAYQPADTSPDGSAYICSTNGQGSYIWVNR